MFTGDLFAEQNTAGYEVLAPQAMVLRGFALAEDKALLQAVEQIEQQVPFRQLTTPSGLLMSVALTNCGRLGWVSDVRLGYRYTEINPLTGLPWPAMPACLYDLAVRAAEAAGFSGFDPDACLINRYLPGCKMSLHQDKDERDLSQPIVSVSLGMAALFQFGGFNRSDKTQRCPLIHGDVVVWGGADRLRFHGILPVQDNPHPLTGARRINLTFRRAG